MAFQVETKDALLHAINEEFVEAVEVLLEHEETIHREGEPHVSHSGVQCDQICQNFSPFLQNFNRIWDILGIVLVRYLANFCTNFGNFHANGQIFNDVNG